jgi:1-phosphatidylinositol-4-phosphate 5-kinase
MFGVNEFDFLLSVCGNANFIEFISNAKSGQFFFYSNDGKYMIKTMTNDESKFLRRSKYCSKKSSRAHHHYLQL